MVNNRASGIRTYRLAFQLILVLASFWIWLAVWEPEAISQPALRQNYLLCCEFLLIGVLFSFRVSPHLNDAHRELLNSLRASVRQTVAGLFGILLVTFLIRDARITQEFVITFAPVLGLTLLYCNHLLPHQLSRVAFPKEREEAVILAGSAARARQLQPWLDRKRELGFKVAGMLLPDDSLTEVCVYPVLGTMDRLEQILHDSGANQLIVLDVASVANWLQRATIACEQSGVRLVAVNSAEEYFGHTTFCFEDDGVHFFGLREEPLENPVNRMLKRLLDITVALPIVLFVLPPVTVLVGLLQFRQSPGPVFFRQVRTGLMGRRFQMIKFRTMHLNHGAESRQATKDDSRVYPAGRWLRRFSLDELPQFLNVLRGDMSVVGPRPHLPQHDEAFARVAGRYMIRKFVPPGITGWAQINGYRGEILADQDVERRVSADIHYLESWSLSMDCMIILRTVWHFVSPAEMAY